MIVLDIPESTPSLNPILRSHWTAKHRLRQKWQWLVRAARLEAKLYPTEPLDKARVKIERWGPRRYDHDNMVAGCKQLVDSLRVERFIVDDSVEHLTAEYVQHIGKRRTRVTIEAVS